MIANPPHIQLVLKSHAQLIRHGVGGEVLAQMLAVLFRKHLGPLAWPDFLQTYHLYLQSIPMDLAREAWGITAAQSQTTPIP